MKLPAPVPAGPGQESVWAYPRPPRLERTHRHLEIWLGGQRIAATSGAYRVLETSHPRTYYLPPLAFAPGVLERAAGASTCEWKGEATYWTVRGGAAMAVAAAWSYTDSVCFANNPERHRPCRLHVRNPCCSHSAGQLFESHPLGLNGLCSPFNRSPYYEAPTPAFRDMAGFVAVYAGRMDECRVDGERVVPQPGAFYGGWITGDVVGPFKGEPGSAGW